MCDKFTIMGKNIFYTNKPLIDMISYEFSIKNYLDLNLKLSREKYVIIKLVVMGKHSE